MSGRLLIAALCGCLSWATTAAADDPQRLEADKVKEVIGPLIEAFAKLADLPLKLELDSKRATGLSAGKVVALVVPDARLTADLLKKLDREVVPLGVLFVHKVTPIVAEQAVAAGEHRTVEVTIRGKEVSVTVLPLAAARVAGRLVLLVYTGGKTPALVTELVEAEENSDWPLDVQARAVGNSRGALVVNVLGRHRAAFPVTGQE